VEVTEQQQEQQQQAQEVVVTPVAVPTSVPTGSQAFNLAGKLLQAAGPRLSGTGSSTRPAAAGDTAQQLPLLQQLAQQSQPQQVVAVQQQQQPTAQQQTQRRLSQHVSAGAPMHRLQLQQVPLLQQQQPQPQQQAMPQQVITGQQALPQQQQVGLMQQQVVPQQQQQPQQQSQLAAMQQHALQQRALQQQIAMAQQAALPQQQQQQQMSMMLSGPGSGGLPAAGYAHDQLQLQSDQQLLQLQQQLGMLQLPMDQQQQQVVLQHQQSMQLQQIPLQQQPFVLQPQLRPLEQQLSLGQQPLQQYLPMQEPPQQLQQQYQPQVVATPVVSYLPSYAQPLAGAPGLLGEIPNQPQAWNGPLIDVSPGMISIQHQRLPQQQLALPGGTPTMGLHMPAAAAAAAGVSSELLLPGMACPHAPLLQPQPQQSWTPVVQQHVRRSSALEPQPPQLSGMLLPGMLHSGSSAASGSASSSNFALAMPGGINAQDPAAAAAAGLAPQAALSPHANDSSSMGQFSLYAIGKSWGL
jgi:hypothetical protein